MFEVTLSFGGGLCMLYLAMVILSKAFPKTRFLDNVFAVWFFSTFVWFAIAVKESLTCGMSLADAITGVV